MSYGLQVFRANGSIILADGMPSYRLLATSTSASFSVTSTTPPLVFTRFTSGSNVALCAPVVIKTGADTWNVTVVVLSAQMRADARAPPGSYTIKSYIFGTVPVAPSGYGIAIGGLVFSSDADCRPLIVSAEPRIDPNGPQRALAGQQRTVSIGSATGHWAGLITPNNSMSRNFSMLDFGQEYMFTNGDYVTAVPSHFWFPSTTSISSLGGTVTLVSGDQIPDTLQVWLIDTWLYD